jgi:methyl-accepting chemotaxis protein
MAGMAGGRDEEDLVRLTVSRKLFGGFGAVVALMVLVAGIGLTKLGAVGRNADAIGSGSMPRVVLIKEVDAATMDYRGTQFASVAETSGARAELRRQLRDREAQVAQAFNAYAKLAKDDRDRRFSAASRQRWQAYLAQTRAFATADDAQALRRLAAAKPIYTALQAEIDRWAADSTADARDQLASAVATEHSARLTTLGLLVVAVFMAGGLALAITRGITRSVGLMRRAAAGIAEGELEHDVDVRSRDELGDMAGAFRRMIDYVREAAGAAERVAANDLTVEVVPRSERDVLGHALAGMAANLRTAIGEVADAAGMMGSTSQEMATTSDEAGRAVGEIAAAVEDVARGAERQVRMVEVTKEAVQQAAAAAVASAGQAEQASAAAEEAQRIARSGMESAEEASAAIRQLEDSSARVSEEMRELSSRSERIGGFVGSITAIAEQTNLLALNAAIEAARAGEQGKGFAVVSEEVRKLAEESQTAAGEISGLVEEMQRETQRVVTVGQRGAQRTGDGVATVERTRAAFEQIDAAVTDMTGRVEGIAAAVREIAAQAASIETGIDEVASVAEESSASAEQVTASSEETSASAQEMASSAAELARTAERLDALVGRFTIARR